MNQHIKSHYLALICAVMSSGFTVQLYGDGSLSCSVAPTIIPRSQGRDNARRSVGLMDRINLTNEDDYWGNFAITGEYTRTFRNHQLTNCLFGADLLSTASGATPNCEIGSCNTGCIRIQGSQVAGRQVNAWLADYFYLPTDFDSTVCFNPRIQNVIVDFDMYLGLDPIVCGMYLRLYGPLTWTKWDLGFCEAVNNIGTNDYPEGYFNPQGIGRSHLLNSFESYAGGNSPGFRHGSFDTVCLEPLHYGRMSRCSETRVGFADLRVELGWNPFYNDCYTFGFGILAAAPTGNNKQSCLLFEPIVGNGHHWEVGGDVHWFQRLWCWEECNAALNFYFDANVTHLFGTYQQRTFDLCNKPMSRYMLAEQLGQPILSGLDTQVDNGTDGPVPSAQFKGIFTPVANLTTVNVKTSVSAEAEILAMFNLTYCNWDFDFGYNFWIRACEKFECPESCKQKQCDSLCQVGQEFTWALKGDARVYGFISAGEDSGGSPVALSATESLATIHSGTNALSTQNNALLKNLGIDNPITAAATPGLIVYSPTLTSDLVNAISTSLNPIFIRCPQDINFQRTRSLSHKVFGNISYNWWDKECWIPFIGVGGFAEFGKNDSCRPVQTAELNACSPFSAGSCDADCNACLNSCLDCSVSQWGVWLKAGVSF